MDIEKESTLTGSFANLARKAQKNSNLISVPKVAVENPPLTILKLGHEALRITGQRITKFDSKLIELAKNMLISMYTAKGIGLAAPQVGVSQRIIVIDIDYEKDEVSPTVLINPEIISTSASIETYEEGCLSIPGVYQNVVRPSSVKITFKDLLGRQKKLNADGLLARCIQHEIDHLNGILFIDRVTDQETLENELRTNNFSPEHIRPLQEKN